MRVYFTILICFLMLNSCGSVASKISIKDLKEHHTTLQLQKGDEINFWTQLNYKYENAVNINYSVVIFKNGTAYKSFFYNPLTTNPKYLSSDERWIISKEKNPDWIRYNENRLTVFGWKKNEDEREDHQKQKHIITYGIKKNVKGKNKPVFTVIEDGEYTFKTKLHIDSENNYKIKKATIILRKQNSQS